MTWTTAHTIVITMFVAAWMIIAFEQQADTMAVCQLNNSHDTCHAAIYGD